jgi:rhodanese-related sulfurtransferase
MRMRWVVLVACCSFGCPEDPRPPGESLAGPSSSRSSGRDRYLDVRTRHEFRDGHIPGARNIPLGELASRLGELRRWRGGDIISVCRLGQRSARAVEILHAAGFSGVRNLVGGMKAWRGDRNGARLDRVDALAYTERYRVGAVLARLVRSEAPYGSPGLLVRSVFPGGPAARILRTGDLITHVAGVALTSERVRTVRYRDLFPAKGKVEIAWRRAGAKQVASLLLDERGKVGSVPEVVLPLDLRQRFSAVVVGHILRAGAADRAAWKPTALPAVAAVHDGLAAHLGSWPQTADIPASRDVLVQAQLALVRAASAFGVALSDRGLPLDRGWEDEPPVKSHDDLIDRLMRFVPRARVAAGRTTPAVSAARLAETIVLHDLEGLAPGVIEHAKRYRQSDWSEPIALAHEGLARIADAAALFRVVSAARPKKAAAPRPSAAPIRPPGVEGSIVAWRSTPHGPIVIGGPGANRYRGHFAAIVDVGGDDEYLDMPTPGPSLLVDLAGHDVYRLAKPSGEIGGVQLWYDAAGDDRYETTSFGLGGAFHGVQLLLDQQGNDEYTARSLSLGAAMFGIGILIDGGGDDRYRAARAAMGFGGPYGFGLLIDTAGRDTYTATSAARLPHPRASMLQGCGMGIRGLSFGGLGMLIDRAGSDRYEADEYAQGVGYVGGVGVLLDTAGADHYRGAKFVQAAGVHGGIGILRDTAGDDRYELTGLQGQAAAWDLGVAFLEDGGGRDVFQAVKRAQAFAANNGIAVLRLKGSEQRLACDQASTCGGHSGANDYAGGRDAASLAVVMAGPR